MAKYTFLAIREPNEYKGVYYGDANIKKMQKRIMGVKGVSSRTFGEKEKTEALKWAGVKEVANVPQIAITKIENKIKEEKEISDVEFMIEQYKKEGYPIVDVLLISGEKIKIQIKDIYYLSNKRRSLKVSLRDCNYGGSANSQFYTAVYNNETKRYESKFNNNIFKDNSEFIKKLDCSEIKYLKSGIQIDKYNNDEDDLKVEDYKINHSKSEIYIPFSSIVYMKPKSYYGNMITKITDETIIKECEKLFNI